MQKRKLTSRLTTLALAIATSACAPRAAHAQTPVEASPPVPGAPAEPAVPAGAPSPSTQSKQDRRRDDEMQRRVDEAQRAVQESLRQKDFGRVGAELAKTYADLARREVAMKSLWASPRMGSPDTPTIISTESMEAAAAAEWAEDLKVMDKVVREEVARAGSDDPEAMGIKLTMIGRAAPMYVEGSGAVFSAGVTFPLAPIGATSGKKDERPRDPASKWERAKRELSGHLKPGEFRAVGKDGKLEAVADVTFDQGKLDALVDALVKALPEATNIRHLKANESVFVTITGGDEGGQAVRLTLKASKADIDATAEGKLTPEEFAKRVARRIG